MVLLDQCVRPARWPHHLSVSINADMGLGILAKVHDDAEFPCRCDYLWTDSTNEVVAYINFTLSEAQTVYAMAVEVVERPLEINVGRWQNSWMLKTP